MSWFSWSAVDCAEYYEVFQKVNSGGGDWEVVKQTTDTSVELNGVPCTEYIYGVQVREAFDKYTIEICTYIYGKYV